MLELYQFELSHYCEKIRLILDYKGLPYRKIEVTPGLGQLDLFRMSGQRQVPVLKDDAEVITDSTAIALYLEKKYPEKPILPLNPQQRALTLMLEEWADTSIGLKGRTAMIGALSQDPAFRTAFLPDGVPEPLQSLVSTTLPNTMRTVVDRLPAQVQGVAGRLPEAVQGVGTLLSNGVPSMLRNMISAVPNELLSVGGTVAGFGSDAVRQAKKDLAQNLEALSLLLSEQPYLVTDHPTLADFAVAGLSMYIKFPASPALALPMDLKGKGVPGLADDPAYLAFFDWRDRLYAAVRTEIAVQPGGPNGSNGSPTKISID